MIPRSLAAVFLIFAAIQAWGADTPPRYTTADWPVAGLGNVRARLVVTETDSPKAVWAHVPWRRHDANPEGKETILVDARTGQRVSNVLRVRVSAEAGDLLFEPPTAPGEYYLYYLPYRAAGEWYFPTTLYPAPTNTASLSWIEQCAGVVRAVQESQPTTVPKADVVEIQSINDFHRFDPMEVAATPVEIERLLAGRKEEPFLLFPEDRRYPIRMTEQLPLRWIESGPGTNIRGEADRGEFYAFQVGVFASGQAMQDLKIGFEDLVSSDGIPLSRLAFRCFNTGGTNWLGSQILKRVDVAKGHVQALWFGVTVPENQPAREYRGTLTVSSANAPTKRLDMQLTVSDRKRADAGDGDLWRQSRLRWLDSTIGLDDEMFAPYTPVQVEGRTVSILGRSIRFNDRGFLESVTSTFSRNVDAVNAPVRELLAAPMGFVAETAAGAITWTSESAEIVQQSSGAVAWKGASKSSGLRLECAAKVECDGYINYQISLRAKQAVDLKDLRLELPLRREAVPYMMGLGRKGGTRPASWHWKWDPSRANNQLWLGDVNGGISCKLKHIEDRWDLYNLKESGPYRDWANGGQGGCDVDEEGERVMVRAYTGARQIAAGETLHFNLGFLITPVKTLDKGHWSWRYFHRSSSSPISEIAQTGASVINLHQGDALNPYINYPFLTVDKLSAYTREAHERQMKVKLYYTIRELSDYTAEFWPLRSLGNEVFTDGPGFRLADQFIPDKPGAALPKTGDSWLCEHVASGYVPAWHTPLSNGHVDAAIATTGLSRWHNYYLEGLSWLVRKVGVDGLYLDGVGYDREIMKRVRKVMQRSRPGCLIDFHSGNNFHPDYGLNNCANQYLELFPCIDSLWFGEGFDYNEPPDYWLVEIAGIPYGLFGEMLQGGGNPWRGMLFGMTGRLGWGGDPRPVWRIWDEFGIQDANMRGYWDTNSPVTTDRTDVLATAYLKPGKRLIAIASWATNTARIHLRVDAAALRLDPAKTQLYAPPIAGFQPERVFKLSDELPVAPGRGWLLLLDETPRHVSAPGDSLRLNQIQVIGTHNSYHQRGHESLLTLIRQKDPALATELEYGHKPLPEQFTQGIRQIELDCFADPKGGLFAHPRGPRVAEAAGLPPVPNLDPSGELERPGFKVLHVQDIDYASSVFTFVQGLQQVRDWSQAHPQHVPIFILVELKDDQPSPDLTKPLPIGETELAALETEILAVFSREQILTPDNVRGPEKTLPEALRKHGWPTLGTSRGKVMFGLDNGGIIRDLYLKGHPVLEGRLLFVNVPPENPAAAWMEENDAVTGFAKIQEWVKAGFLVRTRADAGTVEARQNDTRRRAQAFASGAQFISTDYPESNPAFSDYSVGFEGGATLRLNPVSGDAAYEGVALEPRP